MTTTKTDLNKIHFFKPIKGRTLREQLQGKKLAGAEVVDYLRSLDGKKFSPPAHWEKPHDSIWICGFSLTYFAPKPWNKQSAPQIQGFNWSEWTDEVTRIVPHFRCLEDPMDYEVGRGWDEGDWILIEE